MSSTARRLPTLAATALVPLAVLGVFFVLPVSGMIGRGFVAHGRLDMPGVLAVLTRPEIVRALWFTVWSAAAGTALACALGLPAAHVLHRLAFPGRTWLRALVLVPFVLPTVVVGVAFELLVGPSGPLGFLHLDGSPVVIVAGLVFFNASVVVRVVGGAWESLDPRPGEAAAALGASPWRVFRDVTFPSLRPALVSAGTVVFLFCATAFGIVLTLGGLHNASVETEIYLLTTNLLDLRAAAALSVVQLLVVTLLLLGAARARRTPDPTVARLRPAQRRPRVGDLPAVAVTLLLLALVVGPLATLVVESLRAHGGWSLDNYTALQSPGGSHQALLVPVTTALVASMRIAVDATWMSLLLGISVAVVVTRRSRSRGERRIRTVLDGLFMLPLGVSAVTLGFGFLITLGRPPLDLRDSPLLIPVAQALVALPLVVRILMPVLSGIDDRLRQAAATLGAPPWRALLVVDLPAVWKPLLAAAGFAFACSLGEFGATSFLVRDRPTLPVLIFQLIGHPGEMNFGMALAASVVLGGTTALVMLVVERLWVGDVLR